MKGSKERSSTRRTDFILKVLGKAEGYVSGAELSSTLGITRAGLWKRISSLREKGFTIEAARGKGYRLVDAPDLSAEEIRARVSGRIGKNVVYLDEVASTNDLAMELASKNAKNAPHGTVVMAESQSRGKGRLGRKWASPPGKNIYMSVVLRPDILPRDAALLTLMTSVACARAIGEMTGLEIKIKWPNDLVVSGNKGSRKMGGILLEMRSEPDSILYCVVGIGVNVNSTRADFPRDVRGVATSVFEQTGRRARRAELASGILNALSDELEDMGKHGKAPLLERWRRMTETIGKRVQVTVGTETWSGRAVDIDDDGSLLLETKKGIEKISSGDLTMLR